MKILKLIAAIFMGLMSGTVVIFIIETLSHKIYPPPPGLDITDSEAIAEAIGNAPTGALLLVLLAYSLGALTGGAVSHAVARMTKQIDALITGVILLIFGAYNLITIPHPTWMVIIGIACFIPASILGGWLVRNRKKPAA